MGYSLVDFDHILVFGDIRMRFSCLSTIIRKKDGEAWKEARYHSSLLGGREETEPAATLSV